MDHDMIKIHARCVANTKITQQLNNALGGLIDSTFLHLYQAAQATGTARSTICHHINGGCSKREAQHHRQLVISESDGIQEVWINSPLKITNGLIALPSPQIHSSTVTHSICPGSAGYTFFSVALRMTYTFCPHLLVLKPSIHQYYQLKNPEPVSSIL